jgi:glycosyltransferase involved in cell wall biosynthesis
MNITIILEATLGGTRKHVTDLILHLPKEYNVTYIYSRKRCDEKFKKDIVVLKEMGVNCIELPMTKTIYNPINILCILKIIRILRANRSEVLHLHGAVAGALGRIAALFTKRIRKIFYSPHGGVMHKISKSFKSGIYVFIEKALNTSKTYFVAVSGDEKIKIASLLNVNHSKIFLIPNGINFTAANYTEKIAEEELNIFKNRFFTSKEDFVILYPALFLEAKGHLNFFGTFLEKQLNLKPHIKILLAGDGPLESEIRAIVEQLPFKDQIFFLGFTENIDPYFKVANAVILPSKNEAFGYVLLEALAHKKVAFATNVGGIKDIITDGRNGFLYDPAQLDTMIGDLNFYADHPAELENLTKVSSLDTQKFDIKITNQQVQKIYNLA